MQFAAAALSSLMATTPADEAAAAEWSNLCLEERVATSRQATYEARMDHPAEWRDWRAAHFRYVQQYVRRRHPLSAAFDPSDALRPLIEANQELYRVERIDRLLSNYAVAALGVDQLGQWIANRDAGNTASPLDAGAAFPTDAALADLTWFLNSQLADGRPRFVAFAAEFPDLEGQADWPRVICERCGLAHHFTGTTVTLALFRYSVQEVMEPTRTLHATLHCLPCLPCWTNRCRMCISALRSPRASVMRWDSRHGLIAPIWQRSSFMQESTTDPSIGLRWAH